MGGKWIHEYQRDELVVTYEFSILKTGQRMTPVAVSKKTNLESIPSTMVMNRSSDFKTFHFWYQEETDDRVRIERTFEGDKLTQVTEIPKEKDIRCVEVFQRIRSS